MVPACGRAYLQHPGRHWTRALGFSRGRLGRGGSSGPGRATRSAFQDCRVPPRTPAKRPPPHTLWERESAEGGTPCQSPSHYCTAGRGLPRRNIGWCLSGPVLYLHLSAHVRVVSVANGAVERQSVSHVCSTRPSGHRELRGRRWRHPLGRFVPASTGGCG